MLANPGPGRAAVAAALAFSSLLAGCSEGDGASEATPASVQASAQALAPVGSRSADAPPDVSAPAPVTDLRAGDPDAALVELLWSVPGADPGIAGYNVYRDDGYVATVPAPGWRDVAPRPAGGAAYYVVAFDAAGNFSGRSNRIEVPAAAGEASAADGPDPGAPPVAARPPLARGGFRTFNAMLYEGMPRVGQRVPVAYEPSFYGANPARPDGQPSEAGIDAAVANTREQYGAPWFADPGLVVVDIERWLVWPYTEGAEHERSIDRYADAIGRYAARIDQPVCSYAIVPQAEIGHAQRSLVEPEIRRQWTEASDYARDVLVPEVDALCPSLYTFYDSPDPAEHAAFIEGWKTYAIETIAEARRIAPQMPVYPFVWPQYHIGGNMDGFGYLSEDYWRAQLETVRDHADGVVLWGGWDFANGRQAAWDADAAWYRIFREIFPDA